LRARSKRPSARSLLYKVDCKSEDFIYSEETTDYFEQRMDTNEDIMQKITSNMTKINNSFSFDGKNHSFSVNQSDLHHKQLENKVKEVDNLWLCQKQHEDRIYEVTIIE